MPIRGNAELNGETGGKALRNKTLAHSERRIQRWLIRKGTKNPASFLVNPIIVGPDTHEWTE
jgi:hypothetical protein